jgi:hypothetical protein
MQNCDARKTNANTNNAIMRVDAEDIPGLEPLTRTQEYAEAERLRTVHRMP